MKQEIIVLSLFNGMSTGTLALTQLGYNVTCYSSELLSNKAAIKVTEANFPSTVQLGDITQLNYKAGKLYSETGEYECGVFDVVLSGSPCTDLSIAGKRSGINGKCSSLFYEFIRLLNEVRVDNPNVLFFQENVAKGVDPKDILAISQALDILPVRIDSKLVSAQLRDRYYWTNIKVRTDWTGQRFTDIPQPKDRGILLKDILTDGFVDRKKARAILESDSRPLLDEKLMYIRYKEMGFNNIVYCEEKSQCLMQSEAKTFGYKDMDKLKGMLTRKISKNKNAQIPELVLNNDNYNIRIINKTELTRLQTFPDDYCDCLTRNQAASVLGNGWTLEVVKHIFSFMEL